MYCVCQHDLGMVQLHRDLTDFGSGRYRNHVASNHVNLICVRYFDSMYVVIPLVVVRAYFSLCGPKGMHCGVVIR